MLSASHADGANRADMTIKTFAETLLSLKLAAFSLRKAE